MREHGIRLLTWRELVEVYGVACELDASATTAAICREVNRRRQAGLLPGCHRDPVAA